MARKPERKIPKKLTKQKPHPQMELDMDLIENLAAIQCTIEEIASVIGVSTSLLTHRQDVKEAIAKGKDNGKMSLRRMQFKMAEKSAAMAIWLGKQYLDQKDKQEIDSKVENSIIFKEEKTYVTPKEEDEEDKLN